MVALTLSSPPSCPTTTLPTPNHVQASRPAGLLPPMTRRALWVSISATSTALFPLSSPCSPAAAAPTSPIPTSKFFEIHNSGGVKAFDIITGDGDVPAAGDQVLQLLLFKDIFLLFSSSSCCLQERVTRGIIFFELVTWVENYFCLLLGTVRFYLT